MESPRERQFMKNRFEISSWDEKPYLELNDGAKYSRATIKKQYQGQLIGDGQLEYIMSYFADGNASFVGIEHFTGSVDGKTGSATFEHKGTFKDGIAESAFHIIGGSGSGELLGLTGEGHYKTGHSMTVEFELVTQQSAC